MKKRFTDFGYLMVAIGLAAVGVSVFADAVGIGGPGFGLEQLSGVILGLFALLVGVLELYAVDSTTIAKLLVGFYVGGILFMGLMPKHFSDRQPEVVLDAHKIFSRDFFINTGGFILFGYLCMLSRGIQARDRKLEDFLKKAALTVGAGAVLSAFIEGAQYYFIPGRVASSADVVANILGTIGGIFLYALRLPLHGDNKAVAEVSCQSNSGTPPP